MATADRVGGWFGAYLDRWKTRDDLDGCLCLSCKRIYSWGGERDGSFFLAVVVVRNRSRNGWVRAPNLPLMSVYLHIFLAQARSAPFKHSHS